jgi:DNA-binding MarR family transcriptional regulator
MNAIDIESVREFNRFYTSIIGLLNNHLLDSPYSLPEARIVYELYHRQPCTARDLMASVEMDKGYLSRVLTAFIRKGLLTKKQSKEDGRAAFLTLTTKGNSEFKKLNKASVNQIKQMIKPLSSVQKNNLVKYMKAIQGILKEIK